MFYNSRFGVTKTKEGFHLVRDNWNDFSFFTLFNLYYVNEEGINEHLGSVKIGYRGQVESKTPLESSFTSLPEDYFSLGEGVRYYKKIKKLGDELREECLKGLNDLAYHQELFSSLVKSDEKVLHTSLLRDVNKKNVVTQLSRIALGGVTLTPFNFSYDLNSSRKSTTRNKTTLSFDVEPNSFPPTNIHTIIGTNGSGKTTALKGIIDGYINEMLDENFSNAIFVSFSVFDKGIHYHGNDQAKSYSYVGVKKEDSKTKSHDEIKNEFTQSIKTILSKKRHSYLRKVFHILSTDYNLKEMGFTETIKAFNTTSKSNNIVDKYSDMFAEKFELLSSGHQIILLSLSKIVELIVEKTLIVIDEPETHLHPPLLSSFVRALSEIAISENAVVILATHSPVVLQEVPKSCVSIIRKYGTKVKVDSPRFETFGENIGALTEEVFGLEIPKTGFHSLLRNVVIEYRDYDKIIDLFNNELSIDAKSIIRTHLKELNNENEG